jgi:hypothetical protein
LDGVVSFERIKEILETGKFWCSSIWNLNDPMEGVFHDPKNMICGADLEKIWSLKNNTKICSFSGKKGLKKSLMWGYYANGFKGVIIEVEVGNCKAIEEVDYESDIHILNDFAGDFEELKKRILTTKLKCWEHEDEYRYLYKSDSECSMKIGEITGVYFGDPYRNIENKHSILASSESLKCYACYVEQLKRIAGDSCYDVWPSDKGNIQISQRGGG